MKKKLFVSNLDFAVTQDELNELFQGVATPVSVVLATDRESGRSKGYAFVEMQSPDDAEKAIEDLNEKVLSGRPIRVCEDRGKDGGSGGGSSSSSHHSKSGSGEGGERRQREHLPPIQRMQLFRRKKKLDPFMQDPGKTVDYRDIATLGRFVSERGKILSRRLTGLSAYNQRQVAKAIKRAQNLGLMPFNQ